MDKLRTRYGKQLLRLRSADVDALVSQRWMLIDSAVRLKQHATGIQGF